jgi:glycosyltransferase involved in cell wall biosynthesis
VTRIVSLTPSRVDRDARTFKEATSFARHGIDSVVVEGRASGVAPDRLAFRLHRAAPRGTAPAAAQAAGGTAAAAPARTLWRRVPRPLRRAAERVLRVPLTIALYLRAALREAAGLPAADVYWVHAYHQFPQAWLAARRHHARLVYDAHDFYPEFLEGGEGTALERRVMRGFYLAVEWACARSADAVLTVSDGVADLMAARNGRRPLIVRNCAELRGLGDDGPDVRSAAGVAPEDFLVVMPGNHKAGMRAVEQAIDAFAVLPERAHLVFVGDGYDEMRRHVARRGLGARVHMLGAVAAGEVPAFIRSADAVAVLYLPTMGAIEFALPNGFFAGIAAGLPILWPGRLPEIRRLAEEHGFGVEIEPEDPASIAAGVRALLEDPQRLAELRERSRRARAVFNWEAEERRLLELADRLAGGSR